MPWEHGVDTDDIIGVEDYLVNADHLRLSCKSC